MPGTPGSPAPLHRAVLVSLMLVAAAVAAGCTTGNDVPGEVPSADDPETTGPVVASLPIDLPFTAGNQSLLIPFNVNLPDGQVGGPFNVAEGAKEVLVEAQWACGTPTCRFLVVLLTPDYQVATQKTGDGGVRMQFSHPDGLPAGDWHAFVRADSASTDVVGEIRASAHFGAGAADDYSAF